MAARKSTPSSGKAKASSTKPVIIEPPKAGKKAEAPKKPDVIDAKAVDVTPRDKATPNPEPTTSAQKKPAQAKPAQAKPAEKKTAAKTTPKSLSKNPAPAKKSGHPVLAFVGFAVGGIFAVSVGYFGAGYLRPMPVDQGQNLARLQQDANARFSKIEARISALEGQNKANDIAALRQQIDAISARLDQEDTGLSALQNKLSKALQSIDNARKDAVIGASGAVDGATRNLSAKYADEIDALKAQLNKQASRLNDVSKAATTQLSAARTKVADLSKTVASAARNIDLSQSRARLRAAVDTGKAYGDILAKIAAEAAVDIPDALRLPADTGVVPLVTLQKDFAPAARRALKASIQAAATNEGLGGKLWAFLKAQVGARSLKVKQGSDPDAILSQVEAALNAGDLAGAVDLVQKLPPAGVAEMSDWLDAAKTRLAAKAALKQFDSALGRGK